MSFVGIQSENPKEMIKLEIKSVHSGYQDLEIGIEDFKYNSFRFGPRNVKVETDHRKVVNSMFGVKKKLLTRGVKYAGIPSPKYLIGVFLLVAFWVRNICLSHF